MLHRGQSGDGWFWGSILWRYVLRNGDLFVRSCASVRQVFLGRVCSVLLMGGADWFMTEFGLSDCR